jgi:hypothetical protein
MLLDYLSPLQISSFVQAIRNRYTAVAASIAGFAVLKAVIVLSTGSLTLVPVSVTAKNAVTITTAFDSARIWNTIPADNAARAYWIRTGGILGTYRLALDALVYPNISSSSVYAYLKTLREGAADVMGMVDGIAYQSFEVEVFLRRLSCGHMTSSRVLPR